MPNVSIDEVIRQAIENGDFDNLPGKGKPLDLSEWANTPEEMRMAYSVLKSSGYTPSEVVINNEIGELKALIKETTDEALKSTLMKKLNEAMTNYAIRMERMRRR